MAVLIQTTRRFFSRKKTFTSAVEFCAFGL
jgi:hypothetical protein